MKRPSTADLISGGIVAGLLIVLLTAALLSICNRPPPHVNPTPSVTATPATPPPPSPATDTPTPAPTVIPTETPAPVVTSTPSPTPSPVVTPSPTPVPVHVLPDSGTGGTQSDDLTWPDVAAIAVAAAFGVAGLYLTYLLMRD